MMRRNSEKKLRKRFEREVARDISYASSAKTRSGRAFIRVMENATGRLNLIKRARGYAEDVGEGRDFWAVIADRYGLKLDVIGGALENIPKTGPLVVVSNHPYGILDGLTMGRILSERRSGDFRILAHRVFRKSPDLERVIVPIDFDETKEAARANLVARKDALEYLSAGGAIGIFPGGTVSTSATPFSRPLDPKWRNFTAKMIARSNATVLPIYFEGQNSRLFQIASHLHYTLRMGMLIREFRARIRNPVRVVIGEPFSPAALDPFRNDATAMMDFLRKATYELGEKPLPPSALGHEFEAKYGPKRQGRRKGRDL